ncbi:winged helix-turn-helix domain-containing protein [Kribbella yunnanensis]|uniref:Winged helix-turn-helix domain-containing protein n=1 Tax=Kribbella yunnanensis TaxID=190194 RepID=A0ABN2J5U1_9ACTN
MSRENQAVIRIHFTAADVGRVTFLPEPEPLRQAALAARALGAGQTSATARRWRRVAASRVRPAMGPLFKLISPTGQFPGFLTPQVDRAGLESAIECLLETPADLMRAELAPHLPAEIHPYMRALLRGRADARRALGGAVREFHRLVVGPSAIDLGRAHAADLAIRSRTVLTAGSEALLATLHPKVAWQDGLLSFTMPFEYDVKLAGRGLRLCPSPFVSECLIFDEPAVAPLLVYPTVALPAVDPDEQDSADALAELLGRTRAAVLRTLAAPAGTGQLARRLNISIASASEHARVLRTAGLLTTDRSRGTAHHSLTPIAVQLLGMDC